MTIKKLFRNIAQNKMLYKNNFTRILVLIVFTSNCAPASGKAFFKKKIVQSISSAMLTGAATDFIITTPLLFLTQTPIRDTIRFPIISAYLGALSGGLLETLCFVTKSGQPSSSHFRACGLIAGSVSGLFTCISFLLLVEFFGIQYPGKQYVCT